MNKFLLFILLTFISTVSLCQVVYPYQDIKLQKPSDYKETEPMALSAATFILTTAFAETDANRFGALQFLINWMTGTKEYNFYTKGKLTDISSDKDLLGLYMAAMVRYSLENKTESVNPMKVELNASRLVLAYCDDPKNNFKLKKKYRKLLETN
jgi:hypothetical protein